ncbi:MAG: hypothetical protein QUV05_16285 [Phycisphaerae bacterium]|nr:hypothetical protein [Phycisphaerae bacterium]
MPPIDPIKVYDARWESTEFDDTAVRRLFEATFIYAGELGVDTITLARDARLGAGHVLEIAVDEACRQGLRVIACTDPMSTPQSYYLTLKVSLEHPDTMGLTITASHNPQQYIGVKFTVPTVRAIGLDCGPNGGLTRIRELYHSNERAASREGDGLRMVNLTREYIEFSMRQAGIEPGQLSGLSVVLDAFHGSAGPEIMTALQRGGVRVEPLRVIPDGHFPTGSPNPTSRNKMDRAVALASQRNCTVVTGVDGDGDRIVFGTSRGILAAGFAAIPILRTCGLDRSDGSTQPVLYDPKVNPLALSEWAKIGIKPVLFRNGHSQIKDYMRQMNAVAAVEESGHYYHRIVLDRLDVACESSLMTILLFLRVLKERPQLLDDLWSLQSRIHTTGEFNYQFADDRTCHEAMTAAIHLLSDEGAQVVRSTLDGIDLGGTVTSKGVVIGETGVRLEPGWYSGYFRIATNERSVVRSYFTAATAGEVHRIESRVRDQFARSFGGRIIE